MSGIAWFDRPWVRYGLAIGAVAVAFLLRLMITRWYGPGLATYVTFYPAVMLVAMILGFWAGILATAMVAFIAAYWILPPEGFAVTGPSDIIGLVFFSGMGIFLSVVAEKYRRSRQRVQQKTVELAKANETLRHLSSKLLSAQENERRRIAGELHDSVGACLNSVKFKVQNVLDQIGNTRGGGVEFLNTLLPMLQDGIEECRRIQMDLRPSMLDDLGLIATLSWFCRRFRTIYSAIQVEQEIDIGEHEIPDPLKTVIYRLTQEAMNNIAKHSRADLVRLSLHKANGRMEISIQDNGCGFDPEKTAALKSPGRGLGLLSMRERVEHSGGSFTIESGEGKGTIIRASWPHPAEASLE